VTWRETEKLSARQTRLGRPRSPRPSRRVPAAAGNPLPRWSTRSRNGSAGLSARRRAARRTAAPHPVDRGRDLGLDGFAARFDGEPRKTAAAGPLAARPVLRQPAVRRVVIVEGRLVDQGAAVEGRIEPARFAGESRQPDVVPVVPQRVERLSSLMMYMSALRRRLPLRTFSISPCCSRQETCISVSSPSQSL